MIGYFFDTSALLMRYIVEQGRNWVIETVNSANRNIVFIAQITPVEIVSGISRLQRDSIITLETSHEVLLLLKRHRIREYRVINLTNHIIEQAQSLLLGHVLRAYDAIQLASALEANGRLVGAGQPPLIFVCADTRLLAAAAGEGLATHNPI